MTHPWPDDPMSGRLYLSAVDPREALVTTPPNDRPSPLTAVAAKIGPAWGALSGVIVALVPLGIITQSQADAVDALGNSTVSAAGIIAPVVGGVIAAVLGVVQAFTQARVSKDDVTPVADPRNNQGESLTPVGQ